MARVITLTGPSAAGKSTVLRCLKASAAAALRPTVVPKFVTRQPREGETGATKPGEIEAIFVDAVPATCDLAYEQYGRRYGLESSALWKCLAAGESPMVILNDVRAVEDVRAAFGPLAVSLYVFRESPSLDRLLTVAKQRGAADLGEYELRFRKAQAIHRIYIENIHLFDHVLLNVGDVRLLERQLRGIVRAICADETPRGVT